MDAARFQAVEVRSSQLEGIQLAQAGNFVMVAEPTTMATRPGGSAVTSAAGHLWRVCPEPCRAGQLRRGRAALYYPDVDEATAEEFTDSDVQENFL